MQPSELNADFLTDLKKIRHHLHQHPEIAYQEHHTAAFLAQELKKLGLMVVQNIGQTGLVAVLKRNESIPFIGLRADMDALSILEKNAVPYHSSTRGKMHACGHDGHMTMLLGAARFLAENKNFNGNVLFIFQPAEEGGAGAQKMIEDGLFEQFPCTQIFALHNWPGLPVGKLATFSGPIMAGNAHVEIDFSGKGCHAALPHEGNDLILLAANFLSAFKNHIERQTPATDSVVLSFTQIHAGETFNVLPDALYLKGTLRYFNESLLQHLTHITEQFAFGFSQAYKVNIHAQINPNYPPTINAEKPTLIAQEAAMRVLGKENVYTQPKPSMGAEDFSFMLQKIPGCYAWLGNGHSAGLHNPHYDFNDEILAFGVAYFVELAFSTVG